MNEIQEAVAAEVRKFFQIMHDRKPGYDGRTFDDLLEDSMDEYLGISLKGSCPSRAPNKRFSCPDREGHFPSTDHYYYLYPDGDTARIYHLKGGTYTWNDDGEWTSTP